MPYLVRSIALSLVGSLCCWSADAAALRLPNVISDHGVLQRDRAVPIWGWAAPGAAVNVTFAAQKLATTAAADGSWQVRLAPLKTSTVPATLTVTSLGITLTRSDVLVGDVWLCTGQSNMEWSV